MIIIQRRVFSVTAILLLGLFAPAKSKASFYSIVSYMERYERCPFFSPENLRETRIDMMKGSVLLDDFSKSLAIEQKKIIDGFKEWDKVILKKQTIYLDRLAIDSYPSMRTREWVIQIPKKREDGSIFYTSAKFETPDVVLPGEVFKTLDQFQVLKKNLFLGDEFKSFSDLKELSSNRFYTVYAHPKNPEKQLMVLKTRGEGLELSRMRAAQVGIIHQRFLLNKVLEAYGIKARVAIPALDPMASRLGVFTIPNTGYSVKSALKFDQFNVAKYSVKEGESTQQALMNLKMMGAYTDLKTGLDKYGPEILGTLRRIYDGFPSEIFPFRSMATKNEDLFDPGKITYVYDHINNKINLFIH